MTTCKHENKDPLHKHCIHCLDCGYVECVDDDKGPECKHIRSSIDGLCLECEEGLKQDIAQARKEFEAGDYKTLDEVMKETKPQWEEEFDKIGTNEIFTEFCERYLPGGMGEVHDDVLQTLVAEIVATQIDKAREEERARIVNIIEGMKKLERWVVSAMPVVDDEAIAYNQAINDVLTLLDKETHD